MDSENIEISDKVIKVILLAVCFSIAFAAACGLYFMTSHLQQNVDTVVNPKLEKQLRGDSSSPTSG